jgi:hypothetical protein
MANEIKAAMTPYSTAVTPEVSVRNLANSLCIINSDQIAGKVCDGMNKIESVLFQSVAF